MESLELTEFDWSTILTEEEYKKCEFKNPPTVEEFLAVLKMMLCEEIELIA